MPIKGLTMDKHTIKMADFDHTDQVTIAAHLDYRLRSRVKPYHLEIARKLVDCAIPAS